MRTLTDAEYGKLPLYNRNPFINHGINLNVEIERMLATATSFPRFPVYPSFWLYHNPNTRSLPVSIPLIVSRTWIHERPLHGGALYWLTVFQMFDMDRDQIAIADLYRRREEWFPYSTRLKLTQQ